ncbi:hypothetical protein SVIOM342S_09396 [Streptomyces violaceorubidus]
MLSSALWPRGVTPDVPATRCWSGCGPGWAPTPTTSRLATDATGRLTLAKSVVSDLDVLRSLYYEATQGRGVGSRQVRGRLLTDALVLVRGPLLADRPEGRYRRGSPTRSSTPSCRCSSPTPGWRSPSST